MSNKIVKIALAKTKNTPFRKSKLTYFLKSSIICPPKSTKNFLNQAKSKI